ncbi:MAG: hypothetical protein KBD23_05755 [Gammaproteobacteria bacterium]|nr:hypothetical protein [Gammaproteobacteria bacterium]MBP9729618.1 hypothetical protein [Gammaproteobacteria bacterium]
MSRFKRSSSILLIAFCAASPVLATPFDWHPHAPYMGADLQERQMNYKRGYGDNLIKKTAVQGNFYVGTKLQDNMAVEFGYEVTKTKSRISTLHGGDLSAGSIVPSGTGSSPIIFRSSATVKGPHLDFVGFRGFDKNPDFKLFGSIGVGVFRSSFQRDTLHMGTFGVSGTSRVLSRNKFVVRLTGGAQYMLNKHLGARLGIGWVNTSSVTAHAGDGTTLIFKPKDTTFCGLGVLWAF